MTIQKQHPVDVHEKRLADGDRESAVSVPRRAVVYDPDPHAHLTPRERYALAIQRRDDLVKAKRRSSQKSQTGGASDADECRIVGTDCDDTAESGT